MACKSLLEKTGYKYFNTILQRTQGFLLEKSITPTIKKYFLYGGTFKFKKQAKKFEEIKFVQQ